MGEDDFVSLIMKIFIDFVTLVPPTCIILSPGLNLPSDRAGSETSCFM